MCSYKQCFEHKFYTNNINFHIKEINLYSRGNQFANDARRLMGKPTIFIFKNKEADRLRCAKLISAFVFATRIVQFSYFQNKKKNPCL